MNTLELLTAGILGFLPISEIRGAVPYVLMVADDEISLLIGIVISIFSNLLIPLSAYTVLDLLEKLIRSRRTPTLAKKIYGWLLNIGRRRSIGLKKESYIALALFVGIPLPLTGAWTGTLVAYVLGLNKKRSILAIEIGVLIATLIVLVTVYTGIELLSRLFLAG